MEDKGSEVKDPKWMGDVVSKFLQSPVYYVPLLDFIDENCSIFKDCDESNLECTIVHENFKQLVDALILDFLSNLGIPVHNFVQMIVSQVHSSLYSVVVTAILTVDDFRLFKEMMRKRNIELNSQAMAQLTNQAQVHEDPADLNTVIVHLAEMSARDEHIDAETAKSLSLLVTSSGHHDPPVPDDGRSNSMLDHNPNPESVEQRTNSTPSEPKEDEKEVNSQEAWDPNPATMKAMVGESTALHVLRGDIKEDTVESLPIIKEDIKEKIIGSRSKVSFDKSLRAAAAALRDTRQLASVYEGRDGKVDGDECTRGEEGEGEGEGKVDDIGGDKDGRDLELGTRRMLSNLLADTWKPQSLRLDVDDGEIQHRRRHLQQQRDRILALKKASREKQLKYFRRLDEKSEPCHFESSKRLPRLTPAEAQDAEANRKREMLRRGLARRLKEELAMKTLSISLGPT